MKFPGTNTLKLNSEAGEQIMKDALYTFFGQQIEGLRILGVEMRNYNNTLEIEFTTDAPTD